MMQLGVFIFALPYLISNVRSENWCKLNCGDEENTMCKYEELGSKENCEDITTTMSNQNRKDILNAHNAYRNSVAGGKEGWPRATNMRLLTWDSDLAEVAQRWAFQCTLDQDKCRRTDNFSIVGQNMLTFELQSGKSEESVDYFYLWTDEKEYASEDTISEYKYKSNKDATNFTQIIWAETYVVGCGETFYDRDDKEIVQLVCNYGPAGNVGSDPIFMEGVPCARCPRGTSCNCNSQYPNLCE